MAKESDSPKAPSRDLSPVGFVFRLLSALVLVFATYNPTEWSFVSWVQAAMTEGTLGPEHLLIGILLAIGWTIFGVASIRALGVLGLVLGGGFLAALVWFLIDFGWLSATSAESVTWIILVCLAILLAVGVSWSHIWRRITGQLEVDES